MKITGFRGLRGSVELDGLTQVVVYDDLSQPIFILSSPAPGVVMYVAADDPDFPRLLKELSITSKVPKVING
jgi:hypothetical protein